MKEQEPDGECLIEFSQNLYGRPIDSLNEEETAQLQAALFDRRGSTSLFKCVVKECSTIVSLKPKNGKIEPGDLIFHMDSWPCTYEKQQ